MSQYEHKNQVVECLLFIGQYYGKGFISQRFNGYAESPTMNGKISVPRILAVLVVRT